MAGQAGGSLADLVSLGVLAGSVPRDVVDAAVAAHGRSARRAGGRLPPHVMVWRIKQVDHEILQVSGHG
ncbi:MAG: transposase domain-containing protein [Actinomycetota bacterium]|nr:transposase domain-containing protein [Actinomycetota bacterium]